MDLQQLLQFARSASETGQTRLADAVSQFFDAHHLSENERTMAGEVVLNLIRQAERDLRQALATRLAVQEGVPSDVISFLANDAIEVARPVLQQSRALGDSELTLIISNKSADYWQAIADRQGLSPMVADRLIDTNDAGTVLHLIDNQNVVLPRNSVRKAVRVAIRAEELQAPLLQRPELDAGLAAELYTCVSRGLQEKILHKFNIPPADLEAAMDRLVRELSMEAKGLHWVTPEMTALAKRFRERGELTSQTLIKTLSRGQMSFFAALFAERTEQDPENVVKMLKREGTRPFALACRATGIAKDDFAAMLGLIRGKGADPDIVRKELSAEIAYYDALQGVGSRRTEAMLTP